MMASAGPRICRDILCGMPTLVPAFGLLVIQAESWPLGDNTATQRAGHLIDLPRRKWTSDRRFDECVAGPLLFVSGDVVLLLLLLLMLMLLSY